MPHSPIALPSGAPVGIDCSGAARLLVSVRDAAEAKVAIAACVELLDVKDPARGPLGFASDDTLIAISSLLASVPRDTRPQFSIACGELWEWASAVGPAGRSAALPRLAITPDFVKFGSAELISRHGAAWPDLLASVEREALQSFEPDVGRVLVAYAEEGAVGAPQLEDALSAVVDFGWDGFLIDTAQKSGGRLFDLQPTERLRAIQLRCEREGILFALAGRLTAGDIARVVDLRADIAGVRSAACLNDDRGLTISPDRIAALRACLDAARRRTTTAPH